MFVSSFSTLSFGNVCVGWRPSFLRDAGAEFFVHCGDVVDDGASKVQWTADLFKPCNELFGRVAVFPCIGNHEKNHPHYYRYFALPKPEYYYSYTYGNTEFFVLDTNLLDAKQIDWADQMLGRSAAPWKVV